MHQTLVALALLAVAVTPLGAQPFTVATSAWDSEVYGNHRAVVDVTAPGRFALAGVAWRRPDRNPNGKGVIVIAARTNRRVTNVLRRSTTQALGEFAFEPIDGPGRYYLYYLPYKSGGRSNYPNVTYLADTATADQAWLGALRDTAIAPAARVLRFEAVDSLNAFAPMQVISTPSEVALLRGQHQRQPFLVFPEDRMHSIRMRDQLPQRWVVRGPTTSFRDQARRGEFLAFQLGVYAMQPLRNVKVVFGALHNGTHTLPAARLTSINNGGIGWDARAFTARVDVPAGQVQAMWCGLDVPLRAAPGTYTGDATIIADGTAPVTVRLTVVVRADSVLAGGADEPEKLTRLRWLNSTLGQRNDVIAPYTPIAVEGRTLRILGRRITLGANGLPANIETFFTPEMTGIGPTANSVLAAPMRLDVTPAPSTEAAGAESGARVPPSGDFRFTRQEPGTVQWTATTEAGAWDLEVRGTLEFDGNLSYEMRLRAKRTVTLADVTLEIPYARNAATYAMGLGLKGQQRPPLLDWTWDVAKKNQDGAWLGGVNAGLSFTLRDEHYVRPLNTNFYLQKPLLLPTSWGNAGAGRITWREAPTAVVVRATSGARTMQGGDTLRFDARFLVTPFHPLDTDAQWSRRFYHRYSPVDSVIAAGASVVNIHHANAINPYINYPFIAHREMKAYIDEAHRRGLQVKIYNTVRELSNRAFETYALRSLGHEIYSSGPGGGYSWLQEHLEDDFIAAWFVPTLKDAAVVNSGMSRWHNYYVEGISWLVKNVGIDGLYLDDVAFDRTTMKRVRRMLRQDGRPGILDLHSANQYNERDGFINSAMLYMELFPYIDRLWFGEYFDYEKSSSDFWMTEVSGIPFGLMGEMLEGGGNPWRGMVYGMTNRMPWSDNADPRPLWKLWDDFGMQGAKLYGYWSPNVQVRTGRDDVKATVFRHEGRALVAIASWAADTVRIVPTIDFGALGIDPTRATIVAPAVGALQQARTVPTGEAITLAPGKGILLVIK